MEAQELKKVIESLLFITDQPLPMAKLKSVLGIKDEAQIRAAVDEIRKEYEERGSAVQVLEIAEGFQMASRPPQAQFIRKLYSDRMTLRLSTAAMETLSIVAYKQPLTRAEIEEIRGVEVIAALETLLDKRLLKVVGRKESVGRPLLYGTSPEFLRHFGLKSIEDLPPIDSFQPSEPTPPAASDGSQPSSAIEAEAAYSSPAAEASEEAVGETVSAENGPAVTVAEAPSSIDETNVSEAGVAAVVAEEEPAPVESSSEDNGPVA